MNKIAVCAANSVKISEEVVAKIVETAAAETEGVYSLKKARIPFGNLFSKADRPCAIEITVKEGAADITVGIIADYHCSVKTVAERLQLRIKNDIQNMAGLAVTKVNVIIHNIAFSEQTA